MVRVHTNVIYIRFRLVKHQPIGLIFYFIVSHFSVLTTIEAGDKPADVAVSLIVPDLAVACKIARHKP